MSLDDFIHRIQKLPLQLKQGQVVAIARHLQLGQVRIKSWLAHGFTARVKVGKQWRYPRDEVAQGMLDMAGIKRSMGRVGPLAGGSISSSPSEGSPDLKP